MKKITGKVVSLVLALALVVTSFSSSFAFASTKTMSGVVSSTNNDDIYLVNGGTTREVNLTDYLVNGDFRFETKNRDDLSDIKIDAISHVSGSSLVSLKSESNSSDDTVKDLKLKSASAHGTEVISVLYEGTYTNDNGDEYTVKASKNLNVTVYDRDQIVFGKANSGNDAGKAGSGLDDLPTFANTANYTQDIGIYKAEPQSETSPLAIYQPVKLTQATKGIKDSDAYSLDITSGGSDLSLNVGDVNPTAPITAANEVSAKLYGGDTDTSAPAVFATIGRRDSKTGLVANDAGTTNVTITVKKVTADGSQGYKASSDSGDKYTLKTKIDKKVSVETLLSYDTNSAYKDSGFTIKKQNGKSQLVGIQGIKKDGDYEVTNAEVNFDASMDAGSLSVGDNVNLKKISGAFGTKATPGAIDIGDANVGSIDIDCGNVTLADGKVGDITTNSAVVINSGKAGNIDTTIGKDDPKNGTVDINGGTVGDIASDDTVTVHPSDTDTPAVVGAITSSADVMVFSDDAKATIKSIAPKNFHGSYDTITVTLKGNDTAISAVDFGNYNVKLSLGDDDDAFTGTVPSVINSHNGSIETNEADTVATVNGKIDVNSISVNTDTRLTFTDAVTVDTVDGDGTMTIPVGQLYVSGSASSTKLKLSGSPVVGAVAFKADADTVDPSDFNTYGFTLTKSTSGSVDTFKIASLSFAGLQINPATATLAKGYSQTFTASAYPTGTTLPTGATIQWTLDGGSSDVFTMTSTGNTATVKVNSIDSTFASENKTSLTATLYDADGYVMDDYDAAKCDITATAVPAATSDTTVPVSVAKGASYQMKVTSTTTPAVTTGSNGVFSVVLASKNGNDYFYKLTATGAVGASTGVYLNGTKIFVATVKAFAFTCDTSKDTTVKGAYTFKITSATTPTVSVGSAAFKLAFVSKTGNAYLYKLTSAGAAGTKVGVYVNGAKAFVAIVG